MEQQQDKRLVILDTETTGMPVSEGHRIIEIGCVEVIGRRLTGRHFHVYLQPDRESDEGAINVHGITDAFLVDKPRFAEVAEEFFDFIQGATLVIHNAAFDVGFINNEFALLGQADRADISNHCTILDTLLLARARHPGQRNSLDALCKRYDIDNSGRELHGALLDSELLADVYLAMTGGQTSNWRPAIRCTSCIPLAPPANPRASFAKTAATRSRFVMPCATSMACRRAMCGGAFPMSAGWSAIR